MHLATQGKCWPELCGMRGLTAWNWDEDSLVGKGCEVFRIYIGLDGFDEGCDGGRIGGFDGIGGGAIGCELGMLDACAIVEIEAGEE